MDSFLLVVTWLSIHIDSYDLIAKVKITILKLLLGCNHLLTI